MYHAVPMAEAIVRTYRDILRELDEEALGRKNDVAQIYEEKNFATPIERDRLEINERRRKELGKEVWECLINIPFNQLGLL